MANFSSGFETFTIDDPIAQLAELSNTLHQLQTFSSYSSSSLDSFFLHHHLHQLPDHLTGKSPEIKSFHHQGIFLPTTNIHTIDESSSIEADTKKRKTLLADLSTSKNSVSDQTLSSASAQVSLNGTILNKNSSSKRVKRSKNREEEKEREVVHVRAKRGQATDRHSIAERVRRGKINERLRCLQDIVPGCYKTMGMATMLDEAINYVQSLQNQVEITAASSYYDFNLETDAVESMKRAKAREAVDMGQGRDGNSVFHSSSWTL